MRRSAWLLGALAIVVAAVVLVLVGATRKQTVAFSTAVFPDVPVATVKAKGFVCQSVSPTRAPFSRVGVPLTPIGSARPPVDVQVRTADAVISRGRIAAGWKPYPATFSLARLDREVGIDQDVAVCLVNDGRRPFSAFGSGNPRFPAPPATDTKGAAVGGALTLRFEIAPASRASQLPDTVYRLTQYRPSWLGTGVVWGLLGLVVVGVPLALVLALRGATRR